MRYIYSLFLIGLVFTGFAQAPALINYQGVARDASGNPVPNQLISLRFEILQGGAAGVVILTDDQPAGATTNAQGLFNTQIGKNANLTQITWENGPYFLQVSIDPAGGNNLVLLGTQQLVSVPFAMHAERVPSTYTNNVLTIGSRSHVIATGTPVTLSQGSSTNISVTGGPNYTLSYTPPLLALSADNASLSIVGSNTLTLPVAPSPTLIPSGLVTVTSSASSYTVDVPAPSYDPANGVLAMGSSTALVTPTLGLSGGILYSGPFTNSVSIPSPVTVAGTGVAQVTGGPNYLVNVPAPTLTLSSNNLSISIVGSNSVALPPPVTLMAPANNMISVTGGPANYTVSAPSPAYTGTALILGATTTTIAPTLTFNSGILTSGPTSNSVNLGGLGPFTQAGTSVSLTSISDNLALGLNAASAKLDVYSNTATGNVIRATNANASNTAPAVEISSNSSTALNAINTSLGGVAADFSAAGGYAVKAENNNALNATVYAENTHVSGTSGYFKGTLITESKLNGLAFNAKSSTASDLFIVKDDGYVGVGSTLPLARMDVSGNIRANGGRLYLGAMGGINSGYTGLYESSGDLILSVFMNGGSSTGFGSANSMDAIFIKAHTGDVGVGTPSPLAKLDVAGSIRMADGSQGNGKVLVSNAGGTGTWRSSPPATIYKNLNGSSVTVGTTPTALGIGTAPFMKQFDDTHVDITLYTSAYAGVFTGGATTMYIEIYVDGMSSPTSNVHVFRVSATTEYISLRSFFSGLAAGSHTVTVVARVDAGTSSAVLLDLGGYEGSLMIKETF